MALLRRVMHPKLNCAGSDAMYINKLSEWQQNLKEKDYPLTTQKEKSFASFPFSPLLAKNKTCSETKPAASPFDFMQFLAQHVQGYTATQGHLCHLPVL